MTMYSETIKDFLVINHTTFTKHTLLVKSKLDTKGVEIREDFFLFFWHSDNSFVTFPLARSDHSSYSHQ